MELVMLRRRKTQLPHGLTLEEFNTMVVIVSMMKTDGWTHPKMINAVSKAKAITDSEIDNIDQSAFFETETNPKLF